MRKKEKSLKRAISVVRLYRDDFYTLIKILKDNCNKIEIIADEHELDDPQEIEQINQRLVRSLEIKTDTPYLRIRLDRTVAKIEAFIHEDDIATFGLFKKVEEFFQKKQRPLLFLKNRYIHFIKVLSIASVIIYLLGYHDVFGSSLMIVGPIFSIALVFLWRDPPRFLLYIQKTKEINNFWDRKKDDIILLILGSMIGSAITVIIQRLLLKGN